METIILAMVLGHARIVLYLEVILVMPLIPILTYICYLLHDNGIV